MSTELPIIQKTYDLIKWYIVSSAIVLTPERMQAVYFP